ncbi:hypothetical protein ABZX72_29480 [Streptomyces cyaneofuscatus]|uniref:hypothetical protein n=1 Tax=Streptomyces cyaneofuscatus TaxID=66883 RepID=UPI0033BEE916
MIDIDRRMAAAASAEEQGQYGQAADLYEQLGTDIQTHVGQFDSRAIDAFEGMARSIRLGAESGPPNT